MTKPKIVGIIVLLVVVNISTYCGYRRMNKAIRTKEDIDATMVDHISMLKMTKSDSVKYDWKQLPSDQIGNFVSAWSTFHGSIPYVFDPEFRINVYFKDKSVRKFYANGKVLREGRLHYTGYGLPENYFSGLYALCK